MTTDEQRTKFEAWASNHKLSILRDGIVVDYAYYVTDMAYSAWQAAHDSRDAEVEALRKDAERYRWLLDTGLDDGNGWHLTQDLPNGMEEIHLFADRINDAIDAAMRDND